MGLGDIAAGVRVTTEQQDRGIATVDKTATTLATRLERVADHLPCEPEEAGALVESYVEGASVERAAAVAEVTATTAAKTLYLLGEPIDPLKPTATRIVEDWLDGELSRNDAITLAGVGESEFALGVYVATHEPLDGVGEAVADAIALDDPVDGLIDARSDIDELL